MISNPPYNNNIDLKIIKEVYPLVSDDGRMCFIHPAGWLYDNKNIHKLFRDVKELLKNDLEYIQIVKDANKLFNITLLNDTMILLSNKQCTKPISIYDIDQHGDSEIYKSLKTKILKYSHISNLELYKQKNNNDNSYKVGIHGIRGVLYTIVEKTNQTKHIGQNITYDDIFKFDTNIESHNFLRYLQLKLIRFCLSIYQLNYHLNTKELLSVPYMPTYTHEWTDEMVAKELGLTDEELRWAINWIRDFYSDDPELYKKYFDPEQKDRQLINEKETYGGYKPL